MKGFLKRALFITGIILCTSCKKRPIEEQHRASPFVKTIFQTASKWLPEIDVRADAAVVYGINEKEDISFKDRVESWRKRGYQTQFMTGIAWGDYMDYYSGKWDGKKHFDIAQVEQKGTPIMHNKLSPYVVPVESFKTYLKSEVVKKVIDAGISVIYLEEPEFWARAGYSEMFKEEWKKFYGFPWRPQDESPENTYLSNKLKYHLFYNAIKEVAEYAKSYGRSKGMKVKVFIPTHSLINYTAWQIVSPEASLASLESIDGYVAQVWTNTARTPNYFNGKRKERVFETAFLEYNTMVSMIKPTRREVYLLTDPIEDGIRDWAEYKKNYEATFTAKLLYPTINRFEVMPWPERIYTKRYKTSENGNKSLIPKDYATQMQVMINSLNPIPISTNKVTGSQGIGVLMANSMMFQSFPFDKKYSDPLISNFYGQTLPLIKRGIPLQIVHIENLKYKKALQNIKVLVMSYSNMKPLLEERHQYIANWVKKGGVLIYCGEDNDPYQQVQEWWNSDGNNFDTPSAHLFYLLNIHPVKDEEKFQVGKGAVYILRKNPKKFVLQKGGDSHYLNLVKKAYEEDAKSGKLQFKNHFYLERGPYCIASVMEESTDQKPLIIKGPVIDLYNPDLPILNKKIVYPGQQAFLYNLKRRAPIKKPKVLASAARIYNETFDDNHYGFTAKSPAKTINAMQVSLPRKPKSIHIKDINRVKYPLIKSEWNNDTKTLFLKFENQADGVFININL